MKVSVCVFFFLNCKVFAFRGCDEHADLLVEQYSFGEDECGKFVRFLRSNPVFCITVQTRSIKSLYIKRGWGIPSISLAH